jgi:hypothetical protein
MELGDNMKYICVVKSTGEFLEEQTGCVPGTMIQNSVNGGYDAADLEEKEVTNEEFVQMLNDIYEASLTYQDRRRVEYPSIDEVTVALAEKEEGDSTMWVEVTAKRQAVKLKYPKS